MPARNESRLSLLQHFAAPEDYRGIFGWLCGFSADANFLNEASALFSQNISGEADGKIVLAAMLDPSNQPLYDLNGVTHLPISSLENKPFRLLHAKLALLCFVNNVNPDDWRLRLIVSTGNWTRQTVEESLDLAWVVEMNNSMLQQKNSEIGKACADIAGAHSLIKWLSGFFNTSLLYRQGKERTNLSTFAIARLEECVALCKKAAAGEGCFFDNRSKALFSTILERVKARGVTKRNYLSLGSGFYENAKNQKNALPIQIIDKLREEGLLSQNRAELDLFVNPLKCQGIASSWEELNKNKIVVRQAPTAPQIFGDNPPPRFLHAKFIFSGNTEAVSKDKKFSNKNTYSNKCKNIWLYFGSGNITQAGLMRKASPQGGNLEAGVLLFPKPMHYRQDRHNDPERLVVQDVLPMQWEEAISSGASLNAGAMEMESAPAYMSPPITFLYWDKRNNGGLLSPPEPISEKLTVFDSANRPCRKKDGHFIWEGQRPTWVNIAWTRENEKMNARIPVIDEYGRVGACAIRELNLEDATKRLGTFPLPSEEETPGEGGSGQRKDASNMFPYNISAKDYPVRQMMRFIEMIAHKQSSIHEKNWPEWLIRLEQIFAQTSEDDSVAFFRDQLAINPIYPLRRKEFTPPFLSVCQEAAENYKKILAKAEKMWGMTGFPGLGENCDG